jgi:hypothetical protein
MMDLDIEQYFSPPKMCMRKGGLYDFHCEHSAKQTGGKFICLFHKQWRHITFDYKCPKKDWARMP